jgi:hypothetical protein
MSLLFSIRVDYIYSSSYEIYLIYTGSKYVKYTKLYIAIIYNCNIMLTLCVYNYYLDVYI